MKAQIEMQEGRASEVISLAGSRAIGSNYYKPHLEKAAGICHIHGPGPVFGGAGQATANNANDRWVFVYWGDHFQNFIDAMRPMGTLFRSI